MTGQIVIIGDILLDQDVTGTVSRLCPDTPAPVLAERQTLRRPGGAGLAALLAARSGLDVVLLTALGDDPAGHRLDAMLTSAGVRLHRLALAGPTPEKIRLRADGRTLLRLDQGATSMAASAAPERSALAALEPAAAILVSDYGLGLAKQPQLRAALATVNAPVVWDPHPHGATPVPHTKLVTPNEAEVRHLVGGEILGDQLAALTRGATQLRTRWRTAAVAVTMGDDGALLCHAGPAPLVVPVPARAEGDTCGAGDQFAVAATAALADGALVTEAVQAAVACATAYVADGGVWQALADDPPPEPAGIGVAAARGLVTQVRARGGRVVATGGCFDLLHAGHIATLQAARALGDCLVVCLNSDASVTQLKGAGRPVNSQTDRSQLLAALSCVDAVVVFDEPTPEAVLSWLRPDVWVKGGDYSGAQDLPEAELVQGWGGQTVLVPYLAGRSTTGVIAAGNGPS